MRQGKRRGTSLRAIVPATYVRRTGPELGEDTGVMAMAISRNMNGRIENEPIDFRASISRIPERNLWPCGKPWSVMARTRSMGSRSRWFISIEACIFGLTSVLLRWFVVPTKGRFELCGYQWAFEPAPPIQKDLLRFLGIVLTLMNWFRRVFR